MARLASHASGKEGYIGARVRKVHGDSFLLGRAGFTDDVDVPGVYHVAVLRSPHAHARIVAIDTLTALRQPGVASIVTGEDVRSTNPIPHHADPKLVGGRTAEIRCLAIDEVRYFGEPVAAVVANSRQDAEAALSLVDVTYEPLPFVLTTDRAVQPDAARVYKDWPDNILVAGQVGNGDVRSALDAAEYRLEGDLRIQRYTSAPVETRVYVAIPRDDGSLTLYATTNNPFPLRWAVATSLGLPEEKIRVVAPPVGGSFGLKLKGHPEEVLVCFLALRIGKPVKWVEDRGECFLAGGREQSHRFHVGFDRSGRILALRIELTANVGAVGASAGWAMASTAARMYPSGYDIASCQVDYRLVVTNLSPWTATRGFGKEGTLLAMERIIDLVARRLNRDPADVRRRNLISKDRFPHTTTGGFVIDSGDYHRLLDTALELAEYRRLRSEQGALHRKGVYRGIGVSFELMPEVANFPGPTLGGYDTATVRIEQDGRVTVLSGVTAPGGGNETGIAQIVADELGIGIDEISVLQGDTDRDPHGYGNYSGRGLVLGGGAAALAAREVHHKLIQTACTLLATTPDTLQLREGKVLYVDGRVTPLTTRDLVQAISTEQPRAPTRSLEATKQYRPKNFRGDHNPPVFTYASAVHVSVVDVDAETGKVAVIDHVVAHDCGTVINPTLVEGQMHGGIAMGIGAALSERLAYDARGALVTDGFKTYLVPRATDMPRIRMVHQETPSPYTVYGEKGAGEGGVGGGQAAIANAIHDALAPLGVVIAEMPLTPQVVRRAILSAGQSALVR